MAADGDLYAALRRGTASVVTDTIAAFDETGIMLGSGTHLDTDIVVTATGLTMLPVGGITLTVDGTVIDPGRVYTYQGVMLSGVPNLAWTVGYINAAWTLRSDLVSRYVCRFLKHLDRTGQDYGVPVFDNTARTGAQRPLLDLTSGYVRRGLGRMPKQGGRAPWQLRPNYFREAVTLRRGSVARNMRFGRRAVTAEKIGAADS